MCVIEMKEVGQGFVVESALVFLLLFQFFRVCVS
jgi:hypothetical protein